MCSTWCCGVSFIEVVVSLPEGGILRLFSGTGSYPLSCFAFCGHTPVDQMAVVFSLLPSVPNLSMSQSSGFLISSKPRRRGGVPRLFFTCVSVGWIMLGNFLSGIVYMFVLVPSVSKRSLRFVSFFYFVSEQSSAVAVCGG